MGRMMAIVRIEGSDLRQQKMAHFVNKIVELKGIVNEKKLSLNKS